MKLLNYYLWIKKYNGWFILIAVFAAILFWLIMPPLDHLIQVSGS